MGMFDYVACEAKLPKPEPMDGYFQTKDAACNMDKFTIDRDGKLWVQRYCYECSTVKEQEASGFSGAMTFYGTTKETGRWKEYATTFDNGQMQSVVLVR